MITETSGFEFDKHVLKMDKELVRNKLQVKIIRRALNNALFDKEGFDRMIDEEYHSINGFYEHVKSFFNEMNEQKYCTLKYSIEQNKFFGKAIEHKVEISGSGMETFNLNGITRFYTINNSSITTIPVEKGADTFDLILFSHPQIEIPTVGTINLIYDFNTSFSVGQEYNGVLRFASTAFDNNPLKRTQFYPLEGTKTFWYGKPGEVYYRYTDGFFEELKKSIFGAILTRFPRDEPIGENKLEDMLSADYKREKFKLQGTITFDRSNNFIYQGIIESSGAFPFFLWKDDDGGRNGRKPITEPTPESKIYFN
jgi:hypothetical protein